MSKFVGKLPEASMEEFMVFIAEGYFIAKISLQSSLDVSDASARIMVSAVTIRSASWLQNSRIVSYDH